MAKESIAIQHVLYAGLGGHGSVFFSMEAADAAHTFNFHALFNGVEEIRQEYVQKCTFRHIPFQFVKKMPGKHLRFYRQIYKAIQKVKPDIIFLHGSMAIPAALLTKLIHRGGVKIIIRETQALHIKTVADKLAFKIGMLLADQIVFLSEAYRLDVMQNFGKLYRPAKVSVIPNGIDLDVFTPASVVPPNDITILGMQSRLVAIKDHEHLIKAMAILKTTSPDRKYQLYIAGDGEYRNTLEKIVAGNNVGDCVTFTGMLNEDELPAFLQSLHIYIHASLGETMSTAIMQAMGCGLPIIASDVDGINNMISHGTNGLLVQVKNAEAMAEMIESVGKDESKKMLLARQARDFALTNFSNKRMFENYKAVFFKMLNASKGLS